MDKGECVREEMDNNTQSESKIHANHGNTSNHSIIIGVVVVAVVVAIGQERVPEAVAL